ncbi:hypothetical protein Droror1_Dr00000246 [Drosera rotundifolia]
MHHKNSLSISFPALFSSAHAQQTASPNFLADTGLGAVRVFGDWCSEIGVFGFLRRYGGGFARELRRRLVCLGLRIPVSLGWCFGEVKLGSGVSVAFDERLREILLRSRWVKCEGGLEVLSRRGVVDSGVSSPTC